MDAPLCGFKMTGDWWGNTRDSPYDWLCVGVKSHVVCHAAAQRVTPMLASFKIHMLQGKCA